jgi:hypothetical protein
VARSTGIQREDIGRQDNDCNRDGDDGYGQYEHNQWRTEKRQRSPAGRSTGCQSKHVADPRHDLWDEPQQEKSKGETPGKSEERKQ